jgi:glycosyltransferase involved in cell wall biosynthesis
VPVAFYVGRKLGLPVILDFRDPFGLHESGDEPPRNIGDRFRAFIIDAAERKWVAAAQHVVLNTRNTLAAYRERYPFIESKSSFIRNHYDMGLYDPVPANIDPPKRFTILHTGTLRAETRLDDIGAALRRLIEKYHLGPDELVFRQIGRISEYERAQIATLGLSDFVDIVPVIPHAAMFTELRKGHVLLSMVDPRIRLRIAAKTYDYIAAGIPIVSITENTEVDELLAYRSDNERLRPGDIDGLVAALSKHLLLFRQTRAWPTPVEPPREFSSEMAAERFAHLLDNAMVRP